MKLQTKLIALVLSASPLLAAKKIDVAVISRQDSSTTYTFVVPGITKAYSSGQLNCSGTGNCYGTNRGTVLSTPARVGSYDVRGATLALRLPDGRVAIVNCVSKLDQMSITGQQRSCRVPPGDSFQAEFNGDKAKLFWTFGINNEKKVSETYKLLEILPGE